MTTHVNLQQSKTVLAELSKFYKCQRQWLDLYQDAYT